MYMHARTHTCYIICYMCDICIYTHTHTRTHTHTHTHTQVALHDACADVEYSANFHNDVAT